MSAPTLRDGSQMIFLVGCPRSGTTWLQRLLSSHCAIRTGQESNLVLDYIGPQLQAFHEGIEGPRGGLGMGCYFKRDEFLMQLRVYLNLLLEPLLSPLEPGELFLEKTPGHALNLRSISTLLPAARVIHIIRDPRDTVASLLAAGRSWGAGWAPKDAGEAALTWLNHVQAARSGAAFLREGHYFEVHYEALLQEPVGGLKSVFEFLGLPVEEAHLRSAVEANDARRHSQGGGTSIPLQGEAGRHRDTVKEPEGFVRRATAGGWRHELSRRNQFRVWRQLYPQMTQFGYEWPAAQTRCFAAARGLRALLHKH
jgi:hypothetical protein